VYVWQSLVEVAKKKKKQKDCLLADKSCFLFSEKRGVIPVQTMLARLNDIYEQQDRFVSAEEAGLIFVLRER
jgi:hypothetical protein